MNWKRKSAGNWERLDMKSNDKRYILIFDTNKLYQSYQRQADFTSFSLNSEFQNIIEMINQLDIYEKVEIALPSVIWNELKKQIVEAHEKSIAEFEKWKFPEYAVRRLPLEDYASYIEKEISEYKDAITSGINKIIELPIPTEKCFGRIVNRALKKEAPFEGKDKKSDKGFKDVLIWESILELAENNPEVKLIFYSEDKGFKENLVNEFTQLFSDAQISICTKKEDVKKQLELWSQEIDKYSYQPIEEFDEYSDITNWLSSSNFLNQIIDTNFGLVENGRLISAVSAHLISVDAIECLNTDENLKEYYIEAILDIDYNLKDGGKTTEIVNIAIQVEVFDDTVYSIEDVYRIDDDEAESEI